jgi:hypothetical protein
MFSMSIALDSYEVLRIIGKHVDVFKPVRAEVDKAARALVTKCLKSKAVDLDGLRDIARALGDEPFELLLEGLKDTEVKSVLTRLDKHFPELKTGTAAARRQHLKALAGGEADPAPPPAKPVKKATAKKAAKKAAAEPARLQSEVMDLFRQGGKKER